LNGSTPLRPDFHLPPHKEQQESHMNRHDSLKCFIEDGVLTMQIGVEVIANAVKLNPELTEYDEKSEEWIEPEITDADKFAKAILSELKVESDEGTTLIHVALDTAAMNAIENGAEGIKLPSDV
jgi:hypothetical protein